jgi:hypothetical protein
MHGVGSGKTIEIKFVMAMMMHTLGLVKVGGSVDMMANDVRQKERSEKIFL